MERQLQNALKFLFLLYLTKYCESKQENLSSKYLSYTCESFVDRRYKKFVFLVNENDEEVLRLGFSTNSLHVIDDLANIVVFQ